MKGSCSTKRRLQCCSVFLRSEPQRSHLASALALGRPSRLREAVPQPGRVALVVRERDLLCRALDTAEKEQLKLPRKARMLANCKMRNAKHGILLSFLSLAQRDILAKLGKLDQPAELAKPAKLVKVRKCTKRTNQRTPVRFTNCSV